MPNRWRKISNIIIKKNASSRGREPTLTTLNIKPKHSPIGASSRSRWSQCPGSIRMSKDKPNTVGVAAKEGTAAHELASLALDRAFSSNVSVQEILAKTIKAVSVYTDYVESLKRTNPNCPIHIEHSFDMSDIFDGLYGTADCVFFDKHNGILHVVDYKHGEGLVVEVENNLQLEYYALGALMTLGYTPAFVQMTIVQPRIFHPDGFIRHWLVPSLHFIDVEADIINEAKATLDPGAILLAGAHCIFCPAKITCPQKQNAKINMAKSEFGFYTDPKTEFNVIK